MACQGQTLLLIGPFRRLRRKWSVVNTAPGIVFTTLIFFVTYHWTQQARVLHYTRLERLARDKHSSLLGPFVSYEENEVLWIWLQVSYSQHFIFLVTYHWTQQAIVLHYTRLKWLARDKRSCLLDPFVGYEENEVLWIQLQVLYSQHLFSS
jgi:hypothetical protein